MTRSEIDDLLARHHSAFERHDDRALAEQHAPDGIFESPAHGRIAGRSAIQGIYRYWFTAFPDMRFTWAPPLIDADRAALFWSFTGTVTGPFFGVTIPGARIDMPGAALYEFSDAGIVLARHVFDFSVVLMKAGVLKARPA